VPTDVGVPATTGSLVVRLAGNPSNARVAVTGPGAFMRTLDATTTLDGLAFGTYTVAAPGVVLDGLSYNANPAMSSVAVVADAPSVVTITYAPFNSPPTINATTEFTLYAGALTPTLLNFTVGDVEDGSAGLRPTVTSSAPAMVTASVTAVGSGWTLSLLPGTTAGSAVVTVSVTDSQGTVSTLAITVTVSTAGVVTTGADSGPGSLRAVIAAVPAGATVTFAPSVGGTIAFNSSIAISRPIIIQGPGCGALAFEGADRVQLLYVTAPLTVSGLSLNHGYSGSFGGAIQSPSPSAPLTVRDCCFTGNFSAMQGGAIYTGGNLTLSRSTFTSNRSGNGGAVVPQGALNAITDCTFRSNAATQYYGGAVQVYAAQQTAISNCAFISNSAVYSGGAVALTGSASRLTIDNSSFASNSAVSSGSAVSLNGVSLDMSFCTVTASSGSPALHIINGLYRLRASIVAGNNNGDFTAFGHYESGDYNRIGSVMGASFSAMGNDGIGVTPSLDPVSSYGGPSPTMRLPASSVAVDAIPAAACSTFAGPLATDQRGQARPAGGRCDVGAFERQPGD
jgi:predicted outer membrane repeat protein